MKTEPLATIDTELDEQITDLLRQSDSDSPRAAGHSSRRSSQAASP